jgi:hypothetical protein
LELLISMGRMVRGARASRKASGGDMSYSVAE